MPRPISMPRIIDATSTQLAYAFNQKKMKASMTTGVLPEYRSAFLKYVDSIADADAGLPGHKKYAHLYELRHEGDSRYRLFATAFRDGSFLVYLKEAKLLNPLTDWQKQYYKGKHSDNRFIWPERPFVVEQGIDFTIRPVVSKKLVLGTNLDGSYKTPGTPPTILMSARQEYSKKPSKNAMAEAMTEFAQTYGAKLVLSKIKIYVGKTLVDTQKVARAAYV